MGNSQRESKSQAAGNEVPGTETVIGYVFVCCHLPGDLGTAELPASGREKLSPSFSRYLGALGGGGVVGGINSLPQP